MGRNFILSNSLLKNANYIDGKWVEFSNTTSLKVYDKFNHSFLHEIPFAKEEQLESILSSSQKGFKAMSKWSAGERASKLQLLNI